MAEINAPQAIRFANERIRPSADVVSTLYYTLRKLQDEWDANPDLPSAIKGTGEIKDGADIDGRPILTAELALGFMDRVKQLIDLIEGNDKDILDIVLRIQVNGTGRF